MGKFLNKIILFIIASVLIIFAETIMYHSIYNRYFNEYFSLELSAIFMIMSPLFIFKKERNSFIYTTIVFLISIIIMALSMLLDYASGDIFSIKHLFLAGEAVQVVNLQYINFLYIAIMVLIICLYVLLCKLVIKKNDDNSNNYYKIGIPTCFVIIIICLISRIPANNEIVENSDRKNYSALDIMLYSANYAKKSSLEKYGFYNHSLSEINNILDSKINIAEDIKEIDAYFAVDEEQETNSYTSLLKDMNVITIMIETGVPFAINEYLTPNLYKLQTEGINFNNNHSKNKTNISELIGILGSTDGYSVDKKFKSPYSIANILKQNGYTTSYFHNNVKSFYSRDEYIPSLGFDNTYFLEDINPEVKVTFDGNYPLDSQFMDKIKDYLVLENQKFYSFYTTISTHGPYNKGQKNIEHFQEVGYYNQIDYAIENNLYELPYKGIDEEVIAQIKNYQCEIMDLDLAISKLIAKLIETNQYDNTLLVLYGDHEIYYRSNGYDPLKNYIYDTDDITYPKQYQTILMLSNPLLNQKYHEKNQTSEFSKFTSPYVIVPTILDLLGQNYNPKQYLGQSVFNVKDEFDNIFYSHELNSVFTDKIYSYDLKTPAYLNSTETYKNDFFSELNSLMTKIDIFNKIYQTNYYNK